MAIQVGGVDYSGTQGTQIASAGDGSQGIWYELIASTSETSYFTRLTLHYPAVSQRVCGTVILGVGSAGAEVEKFRIPHYNGPTDSSYSSFIVPLTIASGSRVAIACDSDIANNWYTRAFVHLFSADNLYKGNAFFSSNFSANGGAGVTIDPGTGINTKGSWTEIDSSAAGDADWALVYIGPNQNAAQAAGVRWLVDIATGAASAESAIVSDIFFSSDSAEQGHSHHLIPLTIPSGARLSARAQCTLNDATDRLIDVNILGINTDALPSGSETSSATSKAWAFIG